MRDADISKIYMEGLQELDPLTIRAKFGEEVERRFEELQRDFLSNGSLLMELEETGEFRFWDGEELAGFLESAGFREIAVAPALGDPAQASIVSATRE